MAKMQNAYAYMYYYKYSLIDNVYTKENTEKYKNPHI